MAVLKDTIIQGDARITGTLYGNTIQGVIASPLYGTCTTAAATAAKTATVDNFPGLITGVTVHIKFTNYNTVASPTLNINGTGAKAIMRYGTTAVSTNAATSWRDGAVVSFTYDGTNWIENTGIDDNTTYSSQAAASGGTAVSLVTTGEKYTWNNKSNLAIGTTATTAAAGNHTHTLTIAADSGTNALTLAASTKYKLTAGGSTFIFTTPPNTTYSSKTAASGGTDVSLCTTGEKYTWNSKAAGTHNHAASDINSGTLGVARGGTGATTFTSGAALIGAGTGAVTTRSITNSTAATAAITGSTNLVTMNTLRYALNRATGPGSADTNYTTYMMRAEALNSTATNPTLNGAISWTYE